MNIEMLKAIREVFKETKVQVSYFSYAKSIWNLAFINGLKSNKSLLYAS